MNKLLFKIFAVPLLYFISIWPFWLLRIKSYSLYLVVYYIIGYRKKVVMENLKNSFPDKTGAELKLISKDFYLHFCDLIFETVKLLTISKKSFSKHFVFDESAKRIFEDAEKKNQSIIGVLGHCGNWEWAGISYSIFFRNKLTAIYHPLSNKNFDGLMLKIRSRYGAQLTPMKQIYRTLLDMRSRNIPTVIGMISDQTPPPESAYWTTFLNQDTPVFNGPEKIAAKFNYPVVYFGVRKLKRSYYMMNASVIAESPNQLKGGEISELHTKALEKNIISQPSIWLWSHRRWKHKKPVKS